MSRRRPGPSEGLVRPFGGSALQTLKNGGSPAGKPQLTRYFDPYGRLDQGVSGRTKRARNEQRTRGRDTTFG